MSVEERREREFRRAEPGVRLAILNEWRNAADHAEGADDARAQWLRIAHLEAIHEEMLTAVHYSSPRNRGFWLLTNPVAVPPCQQATIRLDRIDEDGKPVWTHPVTDNLDDVTCERCLSVVARAQTPKEGAS